MSDQKNYKKLRMEIDGGVATIFLNHDAQPPGPGRLWLLSERRAKRPPWAPLSMLTRPISGDW